MTFFTGLSALENQSIFYPLFQEIVKLLKKIKHKLYKIVENYQKKWLNLHNSRFSHKLRLLNRFGWLPQMGNGVSFIFAPIRCALAVCGCDLAVFGHL
jgi:hypothetical protein